MKNKNKFISVRLIASTWLSFYFLKAHKRQPNFIMEKKVAFCHESSY